MTEMNGAAARDVNHINQAINASAFSPSPSELQFRWHRRLRRCGAGRHCKSLIPTLYTPNQSRRAALDNTPGRSPLQILQYLRAPLVGLLQVPCLSPSVTSMNRCMSTLRITLLHSGAIFNGRKRSQTSCHLEQLRRRPSRTAVQMPAVGDKRVQERH